MENEKTRPGYWINLSDEAKAKVKETEKAMDEISDKVRGCEDFLQSLQLKVPFWFTINQGDKRLSFKKCPTQKKYRIFYKGYADADRPLIQCPIRSRCEAVGYLDEFVRLYIDKINLMSLNGFKNDHNNGCGDDEDEL